MTSLDTVNYINTRGNHNQQ